jgi:hypothetical protein
MSFNEADFSNQGLEQFAARVRDAHKAVLAAAANALAAALDAGDAVLELQQELRSRGIGWQAWFREWCRLPLSTAKLYAQLAAHRPEIEIKIEEVGELSLRAARRLISRPTKTIPKSKRLDLLVAWNRASEAERTAVLSNIDIVDFFQVMPRDWRGQIEARVTNLRAETGNPALKVTAVLRKALSLVKTANTPGISAAVASSNKHEALAALQQLGALLLRSGFDLNDITVSTTKAAPKSRRRAA